MYSIHWECTTTTTTTHPLSSTIRIPSINGSGTDARYFRDFTHRRRTMKSSSFAAAASSSSLFFVGLFFCAQCAGVESVPSVQVPLPLPPHTLLELGRRLVPSLLNQIKGKMGELGQLGLPEVGRILRRNSESKAPIELLLPIPPLPEQLNLTSLEIPMDFHFEDNSSIVGFFDACGPHLDGLNALNASIGVRLDEGSIASISYSMAHPLPFAILRSIYTTNVSTHDGVTGGSAEILGTGPFEAGATGFWFEFVAKGALPISSGAKMSLDELGFDFGFDKIVLIVENLTVNGEDADLSGLAGLLESLYNLVWVPYRGDIVGTVRCAIDHAINGCVPLDLISGVWDCLKFDFESTLPECLAETSPTTTSPTTSGVSDSSDPDLTPPATAPGNATSTTTTTTTPSPSTEENRDSGATASTSTVSYVVALLMVSLYWSNIALL